MLLFWRFAMNFYFETRAHSVSISNGRGLAPHPHLHNEIEMIVMFEGESLATADSKSAVLKGNDIYIAFPNQIHFYHDRIKAKYMMIIFSPDEVSEFKSLFDNNIPNSPVISNAMKNPRVKWIIDEISRLQAEQPSYMREHVRGLLLSVLSELFNIMPLETAPKYDSNILKQVIKYCSQNYTQDVSLQKIADDIHVSKYYISHLFGKKLKVNFSDYINTLRVKRACDLLSREDMSIIDIGFAVGYNSTRSFNRCFKNICGVSPKEYRTNRKKSRSKQ